MNWMRRRNFKRKCRGGDYDAVLLELHTEIQLTCSMLRVLSKKLGNPCHQDLSKMHFIKAEIISLEADHEAVNEIEDLATEVAQTMANLNLSVGQDKLEEFVHVNDENNKNSQLQFWKTLKSFWTR